MTTLIEPQVSDALTYMNALQAAFDSLSKEPEWGGGLRLILPSVIPLQTDYAGDVHAVAWLVANDFGGYDLATTDPTKKEA